jgi:hypothetical protein
LDCCALAAAGIKASAQKLIARNRISFSVCRAGVSAEEP